MEQAAAVDGQGKPHWQAIVATLREQARAARDLREGVRTVTKHEILEQAEKAYFAAQRILQALQTEYITDAQCEALSAEMEGMIRHADAVEQMVDVFQVASAPQTGTATLTREQGETGTGTLGVLPYEVWRSILAFLPRMDVATVTRLSRAINRIALPALLVEVVIGPDPRGVARAGKVISTLYRQGKLPTMILDIGCTSLPEPVTLVKGIKELRLRNRWHSWFNELSPQLSRLRLDFKESVSADFDGSDEWAFKWCSTLFKDVCTTSSDNLRLVAFQLQLEERPYSEDDDWASPAPDELVPLTLDVNVLLERQTSLQTLVVILDTRCQVPLAAGLPIPTTIHRGLQHLAINCLHPDDQLQPYLSALEVTQLVAMCPNLRHLFLKCEFDYESGDFRLPASHALRSLAVTDDMLRQLVESPVAIQGLESLQSFTLIPCGRGTRLSAMEWSYLSGLRSALKVAAGPMELKAACSSAPSVRHLWVEVWPFGLGTRDSPLPSPFVRKEFIDSLPSTLETLWLPGALGCPNPITTSCWGYTREGRPPCPCQAMLDDMFRHLPSLQLVVAEDEKGGFIRGGSGEEAVGEWNSYDYKGSRRLHRMFGTLEMYSNGWWGDDD